MYLVKRCDRRIDEYFYDIALFRTKEKAEDFIETNKKINNNKMDYYDKADYVYHIEKIPVLT